MTLKNLVSRFSQPESYSKKRNYKFGKTLGAGTYGIVKEGAHPSFGKVAIKIIEKRTVLGHEDLVYDEIKMLQLLDHPHIIRYKEWFESNSKFYVVTTLATGGELFDRICARGRFSERDAIELIGQVLEALYYLHERQIVHRDIKPENLLYLTLADTSPLVLADFGIAKRLSTGSEVLNTMAGSYGYAAPEILKRTGHSFPADLWSLGVITYTLLCGYSPFRSEDRDELIAETVRADIVFHERYWKDVSQEAKDFIMKLLQPAPVNRMTAEEALKSVWITAKTAKQVDLLPVVAAGFNARKKFKKAVEAIRLGNRIRALAIDAESDDEAEDFYDKQRRGSAEDLDVVTERKLSLNGETRLFGRGEPSLSVSGSQDVRAKSKERNKALVFAEVVKAKVREAQQEANDKLDDVVPR